MKFVKICETRPKKDVVEIYPKFRAKSCDDLMIKGHDFCAVWDEDRGIWTTSQNDVVDMIDREIDKYVSEHSYGSDIVVKKKYMWDGDSGSIDKWRKYVTRQLPDNYHALDETLIFSNSPVRREDYSTKRLPYALEKGEHKAWDELVGTLYSETERHKIEWAIGSVVNGGSKKLQKFFVFYGEGGTGKSTILDIVKLLFDGYWVSFYAEALVNGSDAFALEPFKSNPLVAIDTEAELSKIERNTRLNSLVAHEEMTINEKFKSLYAAKFNSLLFMATNKPVKITDAKSGVIRRLVDISPTGNKIPRKKYDELQKLVQFELGAIAWRCKEVYEENPYYYEDYIPISMIGATNDFYNFMEEYFDDFYNEGGTTLGNAWMKYNQYCEEAKVPYPYPRRIFKEELKTYFETFKDRIYINGKHERSYYSGLKTKKFRFDIAKDTCGDSGSETESGHKSWLELKDHEEFDKNVFDIQFADCPAQYAVGRRNEKPSAQWVDVKTKLKDLDTTKVHYVRKPADIGSAYISVDFDKKNEKGEKSLDENLKAAESWPPTYAEVSKGGQGLHLEYCYTGNPADLSAVYDEDVEIKVCNGLASCRRKLTKCNDLPIAVISSGLPLKGGKRMIDMEVLKDEQKIRKRIENCLNKKHHGATAPEINYIYDTLEKCYASGMKYDVSDLYDAVYSFADHSTNQSRKCTNLVEKMHFCSDEPSDQVEGDNDIPLVVYDFEVYPNKNLVCYMVDDEHSQKAMQEFIEARSVYREKRDHDSYLGMKVAWKKFTDFVVAVTNPTPKDIQNMLGWRLIDFNGRKYDRHIMAGILHGCNEREIYYLSQDLIVNKKGFNREAYNYGWLDLYDCSSSQNKKSLKKWEVELDVSHKECGIPWNEEVSEEDWPEVIDYCKNDVASTMFLFHSEKMQADFRAREMLANLTEMPVDTPTNTLSAIFIFGNNRKPQNEFVYTDLGTIFPGYEYDDTTWHEIPNENPEKPPKRYCGIERGRYTGKIVNGKSIYRGIDPSEGGRVYAEPNVYYNVGLLDIASMHPTSVEQLNLFGDRYTKRFSELKLARLYIKRKEFDKAKELFDGKLTPYLDDPGMAKALSNALKTVINSVYGLSSAKFDNQFKDPRNVDNIVAKRGALFMIELQLTLQEMGYTVAHVKTDSIKIPEVNDDVIQFIMNFGKKYGYEFEHEATYERMCLVNESTYIAKYKDGPHEYELPTGEKVMTPWTATGEQFKVPYVFKTLFSHDPIRFEDMCEMKSVTSALYLDFNEGLPEGEHNYQFVGKVGLFCPMLPGAGGGELLREKDGKYNSATGAKGYRWMEAEMVRNLGLDDKIDRGYYDNMVDEAIKTINKFGDFEMFVSDDEISEVPF